MPGGLTPRSLCCVQVTFDLKGQLVSLYAAHTSRPADLALPSLTDVADPVVDVRIMLWMCNPDSHAVRSGLFNMSHA